MSRGLGDVYKRQCEYCNSFLSFFPTVAVILNIEADHLDFFKDLSDIRHSFRLFAEKLPADGVLVVNSGIENLREITDGLKCRIVTFGEAPDSTYTARNITYDEYARPSYDLVIQGEIVNRISLGVTGEHNVYNSLAAIAVAMELGAGFDAVMAGLKAFTGTDRRFEKKGEIGGVTIIDDYAHHPQEIRATLSAAKNYPHRKLWCVFQPHTYSRTYNLLEDFAQALSIPDHLVMTEILAVREENKWGIHTSDLAAKVPGSVWFDSFEKIADYVMEQAQPGDLILTLGGGDIYKCANLIVEKYKARQL